MNQNRDSMQSISGYVRLWLGLEILQTLADGTELALVVERRARDTLDMIR